MNRWVRAAGLAAFCLVWGFLGAVGGVLLLQHELRGDPGPAGVAGPPGVPGPQGPAGSAANTIELEHRVGVIEDQLADHEDVLGTSVLTVGTSLEDRVAQLEQDMSSLCFALTGSAVPLPIAC